MHGIKGGSHTGGSMDRRWCTSHRLLLGLTGEDEFLLHDVDVSAGPPDCGAQHDLFRVVAAHPAHPIPAGAHVRSEIISGQW